MTPQGANALSDRDSTDDMLLKCRGYDMPGQDPGQLPGRGQLRKLGSRTLSFSQSYDS